MSTIYFQKGIMIRENNPDVPAFGARAESLKHLNSQCFGAEWSRKKNLGWIGRIDTGGTNG